MSATYRIAEVAERSGYSPPTLRYYESIGLLPPPQRAENGYRVYPEAILERLGFIRRAKQLGCSLDEIAELTRAWESGQCAPVKARLQALVGAKVGDIQAHMAELAALAADLQRAAAGLASSPAPDGPCDDRCGCTSTPEPVGVPLTAAPTTDTDGDEVPITCSLDGAAMPGRLDDWSALLRRVVHREAVDGGIRLEFGPDADVAGIARLAAAEQDCCRFFDFALVIDRRGVALEVRAPADAQTLVTALFGAPA